jgi:hypothetical protein
MQSTFIEVAIVVLAGIFGGNAAGLAIKEYNLGAIKNSFAGAVGGAAGYFLLAFIPPTVDAGGNPVTDTSLVNHMFILALTEIGAGGVLTLVLGFVMGEMARSRAYEHKSILLRVMAEISKDFVGRLGLGCRKLHGERGTGTGRAVDR